MATKLWRAYTRLVGSHYARNTLGYEINHGLAHNGGMMGCWLVWLIDCGGVFLSPLFFF